MSYFRLIPISDIHSSIRCHICDRDDCWQPLLQDSYLFGLPVVTYYVCFGFGNTPEHEPITGSRCYAQPVGQVMAMEVFSFVEVEPELIPLIEELNGWELTFEHHVR